MAHSKDNFELLHLRVKQWCSRQGWRQLRDIQDRAIKPVLSGQRDVIISASTASGKTEAAFMPVFSKLAEGKSGIGALYVSPLKALINDQTRRLSNLGEATGIKVTPWHGDVAAGVKNSLVRDPEGVLLITPESLEAWLLRNMGRSKAAFANLQYIVIDEFHSFVGSVRGQQLLSLLARVEFLVGRTIPRIALSATLGDMPKIASLLKGNRQIPTEIIVGQEQQNQPLLSFTCLIEQSPKDIASASPDMPPTADENIAQELFTSLRGKSNLVFTNSRRQTEVLANILSNRCSDLAVKNEFLPHHGSLHKDIRERTEKRLQSGNEPTTVICTSTLELGIDIGDVDEVAQVGCPGSVASLRQRMGRSGRRTGVPSLAVYVKEREIQSGSHLVDRLHTETFQTLATIDLLLQGKYESPVEGNLHLSTLVQQTLSVVGQYGSARADQLYSLLCKRGPFSNIDQSTFASFLRALGQNKALAQSSDGAITLGINGERLTDHYQFFAAFDTDIEYTLQHGKEILGTLPVFQPVAEDQHIVFNGRQWRIVEVVADKQRIHVVPARAGSPPRFGSYTGQVNDLVRQRMKTIYSDGVDASYANETGKQIYAEGRKLFLNLHLAGKSLIDDHGDCHLLVWAGDRIVNTLNMILVAEKCTVDQNGPIITVKGIKVEDVQRILVERIKHSRVTPNDLVPFVKNPQFEKFDRFLNSELQLLGYGHRTFDCAGTTRWIETNLS